MTTGLSGLNPWQRRKRLRFAAGLDDSAENVEEVFVVPADMNSQAVAVSPTEVNSDGEVSCPGSEAETVLDGSNGKSAAKEAVVAETGLPSSSSGAAAELPTAAPATTLAAAGTTSREAESGSKVPGQIHTYMLWNPYK